MIQTIHNLFILPHSDIMKLTCVRPEEAQIWVTKRVVMKINGKLTVGIIVAFSPKTLK